MKTLPLPHGSTLADVEQALEAAMPGSFWCAWRFDGSLVGAESRGGGRLRLRADRELTILGWEPGFHHEPEIDAFMEVP